MLSFASGIDRDFGAVERIAQDVGVLFERDACWRVGWSLLGQTPAVVPEVRYAMSGGLHVAYQVVGSGPPDLVLIPEWSGNVELRWDEPRLARFLSEMASFSRLLVFDKRGVGLSDPVALSELPSLEEWGDDVLAVMGSAGSERAAIVAVGQGGPMAMVFAATHPDRVASLVLVNTLAGGIRRFV